LVTDEAQRILDAAMQLDDDDRAEVAAILMDGLGNGESAEAVDAAWRIEIERRLAAMREGTMPMVSSEDVKLEMREIVERARVRRSVESHPGQARRIVG
jgi:putative addiction module component (TIGR02574 family)